jgi:hypothetical protein
MSKDWNPHDGEGEKPAVSSSMEAKHAKDSARADWEEFFAFLRANATAEDAVSVGSLDDILGE